jgi:hypothetical protein
MNTRHVGVLAAIVVGLVILLFALQTDDTGTAGSGERLLPGLETAANGLTRIRIDGPGGDVTLRRGDGGWVIEERGGYPADIDTLRSIVLALAEARIVEQKTADPANYGRLGVGDPAEGGDGDKVMLESEGASFAVILGDPARDDFRYARVAGDARSVLIDRNPVLPDDVAGWLDDDLLDIDAGRVRRVTIRHDDGETIVIEKEDETQDAFTVLDVPEDRELQYASVADPVAGVLADLKLEDVRRAPVEPGEADTTAVFETFDGTTVTVTVDDWVGGGDDAGELSWVRFSAAPDIDGLNERTAGWEYRLPAYKRTQLVRRWEDLLKAGTADEPLSTP